MASTRDLLERLDERFALGEISEETYCETRDRLLSRRADQADHGVCLDAEPGTARANDGTTFATRYVHPEEMDRIEAKLDHLENYVDQPFDVLQNAPLDWGGILRSGAGSIGYDPPGGIDVDPYGLVAAGRLTDLAAAVQCVREKADSSGSVKMDLGVFDPLCTGSTSRVLAEVAMLESGGCLPEAAVILACALGQDDEARDLLVGHQWTANPFQLATCVNITGNQDMARAVLDPDGREPELGFADVMYPWKAEGWLLAFRDVRQAIRCMVVGEENAKNCGTWIESASAWRRLFADAVRARESLLRAEHVIGSTEDAGRCAVLWLGLMEEVDAAERCMRQCELSASSTFDLCQCVGWWSQFGDRTKDMVRCADEAERRAQSVSDLLQCGRQWHFSLTDEGKHGYLLAKAEAVCVSCGEFLWVAGAWYDEPDDGGAMQRCYDRAVAVAETAGDWAAVAYSSVHLNGDLGEGQRSLVMAERAASSARDWRTVAESWRTLLADGKAALRCEQLAARAE